MSECNSLLNCYHEFHRCRVHVYSLRHAKDPVMGTIMVTKHVTCHSEDVSAVCLHLYRLAGSQEYCPVYWLIKGTIAPKGTHA